SINKNG
ncbi:hypothetical protein D018_2132B, partial [Vibrio parahaemolyticus VP2007-007]